MAIIMINDKCKQYTKADSITKNSVKKSLEGLSKKLLTVNRDVNNIYNMDSIVYDRINSEMFMYKSHGMNNTQLRIVYSVKQVGADMVIYLVDFFNKKSNDKDYLSLLNHKFRDSHISDFSFKCMTA